MVGTAVVFTLRLDDEHHLRLIEEGDADDLYRLVAANREFLERWMLWAARQTLEGTLEFIRSSRKQLGANQGFQAAMLERDAIVGTIGFHRLDWENRSTSIGYWIAEDSACPRAPGLHAGGRAAAGRACRRLLR